MGDSRKWERALLTALVGGGLLWGLWVLLWRSTSLPVLLSGLWCPLTLLFFSRLSGLGHGVPLHTWARIDLWVGYFALFGLGVVRGVIRTSLSIIAGVARPGIIAIPLQVGSDLGKFLLVLAITASPGTIALLAEEEILYVHCLHLPSGPDLPGIGPVRALLVKLTG